MNVTTTTRIMFERQVIESGTKLDLPDEQAKDLIAQGVAERAKKTVEVNDDAPQAPAKAPTDTEASKTDKPLSKMNRTELEAVAEGLGMDDLEQYDSKAKLEAAIKERQNA